MSEPSSEAAWHPDPTGRHQHRYWNGGQWTAWVADDGVRGEDPLAPAGPGASSAAPGDLESVAGLTRLQVEMLGGRSPAGWRAVRDETGADVGRLWCEREVSRLCDASGAPLLTVTARVMGRGSDRNVAGLAVEAAATGPIASVSYTQARTTTLKCNRDGARLLTIQLRRSMAGKLTDIALFDGDDRQIGTITETDRQARGTTVSGWLVLDRDAALTDPVRILAVAAPVVLDCFLHADRRG